MHFWSVNKADDCVILVVIIYTSDILKKHVSHGAKK